MIVSNCQSQKLSLYYIGSNLVNLIRHHQFKSICPSLLFNKYCDNYDDISFSYFIYGLDWLYIIGTIRLTQSGDVTLCN
ncbi:ABC-three component system middle component 6 [Vibrio splendidus]